MRGKKAAVNMIMSLLEEMFAAVCSFILPRLILTRFGSKYNGITSSITQFLACAVLLRAGIDGVTRAALYKPLAESDWREINGIVKATDIFMKKISCILAFGIILFAVFYPFLVNKEFEWFFTFSLFLIIGAGTFAQNFFGITYYIVLQADQRLWIVSLMQCICYILNTGISSYLIIRNASIHWVKVGSSFVYVLYPIILGMYVRYYYHIDMNVAPNNKAVVQRWDAFWQQIALFVMSNTDMIVLTVFSDIMEVSVYSIYNMIIIGLRGVIRSFSNSQEAVLGNMIARKEDAVLRENVSIIETVIYGISTVIYTSAAILILDFVRIYTRGVSDVEYIRPVFAYLFILGEFFNGIRLPYQLVVQAAGCYKQTKNGAVFESAINIFLSVILVIRFGIIGVAVGTLAAIFFRLLQYSSYMSQNLILRSRSIVFARCLVSLTEAVLIMVIVHCLKLGTPVNYTQWAMKAVVVCGIAGVIVAAGNFMVFREDVLRTFAKVKRIIME